MEVPGSYGHHADTMMQFMWQATLNGTAKFVTERRGACHSTDLMGVRHLISRERCNVCLSLSLIVSRF